MTEPEYTAEIALSSIFYRDMVGLAFDAVLVAFGLERLIYRLSIFTHCDGFVLKGGMLVALRTSGSGRFTCDIDILALGSDDKAKISLAPFRKSHGIRCPRGKPTWVSAIESCSGNNKLGSPKKRTHGCSAGAEGDALIFGAADRRDDR